MGKIMEDEADYYNAFRSFSGHGQEVPLEHPTSRRPSASSIASPIFIWRESRKAQSGRFPWALPWTGTVEMYQQIIKNAPYGTYAPEAQFKIGLAREQQRKYTDAVEAYQTVLDNYPTSSTAPNAQYQIGYAWMRATDNANDEGAARKAIDSFQDFLVRYPNSDKAEQAQENIQHLSQKQTQGAYSIAQFYERSHPPDNRAAFIYYNEVVREDPNGPPGAKGEEAHPGTAPHRRSDAGWRGSRWLARPLPDQRGGQPGWFVRAHAAVALEWSQSPIRRNTGPGDLTTPGPTTEPSTTGTPDPGTAAAPTPTSGSAAPGASTPGDAPSTNAAPVSAPPDGTTLPQ